MPMYLLNNRIVELRGDGFFAVPDDLDLERTLNAEAPHPTQAPMAELTVGDLVAVHVTESLPELADAPTDPAELDEVQAPAAKRKR